MNYEYMVLYTNDERSFDNVQSRGKFDSADEAMDVADKINSKSDNIDLRYAYVVVKHKR